MSIILIFHKDCCTPGQETWQKLQTLLSFIFTVGNYFFFKKCWHGALGGTKIESFTSPELCRPSKAHYSHPWLGMKTPSRRFTHIMTRADPLMINEHASQATCSTDLLNTVPGIEGFVNTSRLSKWFVLLRLWQLLTD